MKPTRRSFLRALLGLLPAAAAVRASAAAPTPTPAGVRLRLAGAVKSDGIERLCYVAVDPASPEGDLTSIVRCRWDGHDGSITLVDGWWYPNQEPAVAAAMHLRRRERLPDIRALSAGDMDAVAAYNQALADDHHFHVAGPICR